MIAGQVGHAGRVESAQLSCRQGRDIIGGHGLQIDRAQGIELGAAQLAYLASAQGLNLIRGEPVQLGAGQGLQLGRCQA